MQRTSRAAVRTAIGVLGGATLLGALATGMSAAVPASEAIVPPTVASVSSSTRGIHFVGSSGPDKVALSRAGSATAPLVVLDTAGPLTIGANCRPKVDDPQVALCAAPVEADGSLRPVVLETGTGNDIVAHGVSLAIPLAVDAGPGTDVINGGPGNDVFAGGPGADRLRSNAGNDQLTGNLFDSPIPGTATNSDGFVDVLEGEDGKDFCVRSPLDPDSAGNTCENVVDDR